MDSESVARRGRRPGDLRVVVRRPAKLPRTLGPGALFAACYGNVGSSIYYALGVTAAFNLNLLGRINRELDGDFDLHRFEHVARFNEQARSVEMHLRSRRKQTVTIPRAELSVTFLEDETIWTESSHKYSAVEMLQIAKQTGFRCEAQWVDHEWPFAENLLIAE